MTPTELNNKLIKLLAQSDTAINKLMSRSETALVRNYKLALEEIKKEIAAIYEKYGDQVKYADMVSYNRLTNIENQIAVEIKTLTNESIKTTTNSIKNIYSETFYRTGFALEKTLDVKLGFGMLNPTVISASVLNPLDRIKWPDRMKDSSQKLMSSIRQELTQGLIQGKGYSKMAKAISDKTNIAVNSALRIARTEGHRVQSAAKIVGFEKVEKAADVLGMEISRVWVANLDDSTRDTHGAMDGQAADENGMFTSPSGATAEAPGMFGVPEEDINCRCTVRTEIKGFTPKTRLDDNTGELIPYQTYQEYYEGKILKK